MKRRNLLAAAPAVGFAGLMAAGAAPVDTATDTPVIRKYRQWRAHYDAWVAMPLNIPLQEDDRLGARLCEIEDEMMQLPSQTP